MDNKPIGAGEQPGAAYSHKGSKKPKEKDEESVLDKIKDFFVDNIVGEAKESPYGGKEYKINKKMYGVAAAEVAAGGAIGYSIGAEHQAKDIVTHETIMKDVMKSVKVGEREVTGGNHYHYGYNFMEGEFEYHYGYDPSYTHTESVYEQVPTGEKVPVELTHHTEKFPHTGLQGLLTGTLVGGAFAGLTLFLSKILAMNKSS